MRVPLPGSDGTSLTDEERRTLREALRRPRGRYDASRAAQLSGVPQRTVYHWAKEGTLKPDYFDDKPKAWSYRDLVYLRLTAWLRGRAVELSDVVAYVGTWRHEFEVASEESPTDIHTDGAGGLSVGPMSADLITGQNAFETMIHFTGTFDLLEPVDHDFLGRHALWGPNLVRPSAETSISPWVMSGEPCIRHTRIPTAGLYAMHIERGLTSEDLAYLYPDTTPDAIDDAITLESRLRQAA